MTAAAELSTLGAYLEHWRRLSPAALACVDGDRACSWDELGDRVDRAAAALIGSGVQSRDIVAARAVPDLDFWVTFLATVSIGAVWLGLNPKLTDAERQHILDDARPRLLLDLTQTGAPRVAVDEGLAARRRAVADDIAAIVYTSGSTGRPKGALLSHGALTSCSRVQAEHWSPGVRPTVLVNLPVSHVGCIGDLAAYTLVSGGTTVMQPQFDAEEVLQLIARHRVTHWAAVPAMFALSARTATWSGADLSSVQRVIWSGGAMPQALARELGSRVGSVMNCYGMTETVGSVTFTDPSDPVDQVAASIGRVDPRYELRLVRDGEVGDEGEIQVRGGCRFSGYLHEPAASTDAADDGWLRTGDLAVRLEDGRLQLTGRLRDMFKSGGYNVYPREIELALEGHPLIELAAVIAAPDPLYGEVGRAWVQVVEPVEPAALLQWLRERLAAHKIPKALTIVEQLPLLTIGKVDKQTLIKDIGALA